MKSIFVGNLDFGTTEDSIRGLFEQHGAVDKVNLIRDRDTGQPRGFAFVEMADDAEGEKAIAGLNGATLGGRALSVNEARPKRDGGSSRGGGRGPTDRSGLLFERKADRRRSAGPDGAEMRPGFEYAAIEQRNRVAGIEHGGDADILGIVGGDQLPSGLGLRQEDR